MFLGIFKYHRAKGIWFWSKFPLTQKNQTFELIALAYLQKFNDNKTFTNPRLLGIHVPDITYANKEGVA